MASASASSASAIAITSTSTNLVARMCLKSGDSLW